MKIVSCYFSKFTLILPSLRLEKLFIKRLMNKLSAKRLILMANLILVFIMIYLSWHCPTSRWTHKFLIFFTHFLSIDINWMISLKLISFFLFLQFMNLMKWKLFNCWNICLHLSIWVLIFFIILIILLNWLDECLSLRSVFSHTYLDFSFIFTLSCTEILLLHSFLRYDTCIFN